MEGSFYKTKESVEEYIKAAEGFNGSKQITDLKEILPTGAKLLEIGSGPGTDWEILNQTFQVVGSDNSQEFLIKLSKSFPDHDFLELDAITLDTTQHFDGIYSNKVLHHLTDDELLASIKRQFEILSPFGIVCHTFWKGEGSETFKGMFVNYHLETDIKKFFNERFDTLLLKEYEEFEPEDSILFIGKKKY